MLNYGIYRGSIYDINDPENRGRVRLLVPQVLGEAPSAWAEPTLQVAYGYKPVVADKTWVLFEGGDINRPTYISKMEVNPDNASPTFIHDLTVDTFWAGLIDADMIQSGDISVSDVLDPVTGNTTGIGKMEAVGPLNQKIGLSTTEIYSKGIPPVGDLDGGKYLLRFSNTGETNIVTGNTETGELTVTGEASFRGDVHLRPNTTLILEKAVKPPATAPIVTPGWYSITLATIGNVGTFRGLCIGHDGCWYRTLDEGISGRPRIVSYNPDGSSPVVRSVPEAGFADGDVVYGIAYVNGFYVLLVDLLDTGYTITVYDTNWVKKSSLTPPRSISGANEMIGVDHTNNRLLYAYEGGSSLVRVRSYSVNATTGAIAYISEWTSAGAYNYDLGYVSRHTFDYAVDRYVVKARTTSAGGLTEPFKVHQVNTPFTSESAKEWPANGYVSGGWWDGTRFWSVNTGQTIRRYEGGRCMWTSGTAVWLFNYTWYDNDIVTKTVTNKALTSLVVTLTTSTDHDFVLGQSVLVASVGAPFDGTFVITAVPSTASFKYSVVSGADVASAAATGTASSIRHETTASPDTTVTMKKRQRVVVSTTPIPTGTGEDANSIRIYRKLSGGSFAREITTTSTTWSLDSTVAAEGGALVPVAFADGIASAIESSAVDGFSNPLIDLRADGYASITDLKGSMDGDDPDWIAPTLLNSWVDYGGVLHPPAGYRMYHGRVYLRGLVKNGSDNLPIFTLPLAYRPEFIHAGTAYVSSLIEATGAASAGTAHTHPVTINYTACGLYVAQNGDVYVPSGDISVSYLSLSAISFFPA